MLPTYLYGYMRRRPPGVSPFIRSIIGVCLVGFFLGYIFFFFVFTGPMLPLFVYLAILADVVAVFAGLYLFGPTKWFCKKQERLDKNAVMTFCGAVISVLVFVAGIQFDGYKHLEGELTIWSMYETEDGQLAEHGDRMDMIATIQNSGNTPLSIERIYLVLGDGKEVNLLINGEGEKANSKNTRSSSLEYYGFPVNNGEAVRLALSIEGDKKEEIIQKVNAQGFNGCFVKDISGEPYKLEVKTYLVASDSKTNYFSFAPNPKES